MYVYVWARKTYFKTVLMRSKSIFCCLLFILVLKSYRLFDIVYNCVLSNTIDEVFGQKCIPLLSFWIQKCLQKYALKDEWNSLLCKDVHVPFMITRRIMSAVGTYVPISIYSLSTYYREVQRLAVWLSWSTNKVFFL